MEDEKQSEMFPDFRPADPEPGRPRRTSARRHTRFLRSRKPPSTLALPVSCSVRPSPAEPFVWFEKPQKCAGLPLLFMAITRALG